MNYWPKATPSLDDDDWNKLMDKVNKELSKKVDINLNVIKAKKLKGMKDNYYAITEKR